MLVLVLMLVHISISNSISINTNINMTICIRRNFCISITLVYMKNTNILMHECVNIPVFHIVAVYLCTLAEAGVCVCVSSGINIHVNIHMNMVNCWFA